MKNVKKILLLVVLSVSIQSLFAYKLVKIRDHWGIFGGFSSIEDNIEGHTNSAGVLIIDKVTITCSGHGQEKCQYDGQIVQTNDGVFEQAGIQIINSLFKRAEDDMEAGIADGSFSENYAILQTDGTYKVFNYHLVWTSLKPLEIELNIIEIPTTN